MACPGRCQGVMIVEPGVLDSWPLPLPSIPGPFPARWGCGEGRSVLLVANPEREFVGQDDGSARAKPNRLSFTPCLLHPAGRPGH